MLQLQRNREKSEMKQVREEAQSEYRDLQCVSDLL